MDKVFIKRAPEITRQMATRGKVGFATMIRETQQILTSEPVEFEKQQVEVQDCREFTDHFGGIYRVYRNLINVNRRMSTCNRMDLQTLGSITTGYAQNPPRSLVCKLCVSILYEKSVGAESRYSKSIHLRHVYSFKSRQIRAVDPMGFLGRVWGASEGGREGATT